MKKLVNIPYGICRIFSVGILIFFSIFNAHAQQVASNSIDQTVFHRMKLGEYEITALTDGTVPIDLHQVLTGITGDKINALTRASFQKANVETSVNAYLIKVGGKNILIDAGTAELYGPTLGRLPENLRRIGMRPEQIDAVLITHIHSDHTGGLVQDGKRVYSNATIYISAPELDYWLNAENKAKAPERLLHWFKEAEEKVGPYLKTGQVKRFDYGRELFPGLTPIAAPGHTPGHTFYSLQSGTERIVFIGDLVHAAAVQFEDPSVTINFDVDSEAAAKTRLLTFNDAAAKGYWLAGDHISFPGIGHLRKNGKGFLWVPLNYSTLGIGQ